MTPEKRFWSHVKKTDDCWLWTGSQFSNGYGYFQVRWKPRKVALAHRFAYEQANGAIPKGRDLDHLCRVRHCVNPEHLEPVSRSENLKRSPGLMGRANREKTHCKRGHPLSGENLYEHSGSRHCRKCRTEWMRQKRAGLAA